MQVCTGVPADRRLPVTLLTGDPGTEPARVAAQVLGADPDAVVVVAGFTPEELLGTGCQVIEIDPEVADLEEGCSCCRVRFDLITVLHRLAARRHRVRRVVVQLDSDADAATAVQTMLGDSELRRRCALDAVVHVVDVAASLSMLPAGHHPTHSSAEALALADHVVLNGASGLSAATMGEVRRSLRHRAPQAALATSPHAATLAIDSPHRAWSLPATERRLLSAHDTHLAEGGNSVVRWMTLGLPGALDPDRLQDWIHDLNHESGPDLLKVEAVFAVDDEPTRWVALGVRSTLELADGTPWNGHARSSSIRLVGRGLDPVAVRDRLVDCLVV